LRKNCAVSERCKWVANNTVYIVFGSIGTASPPENNEEIDKGEAKQV
jgi:hypothetical protein